MYKVGSATEKVTYTVKETTTYPGYTPDNDTVASGGTITNKQVPTEVTAIKSWVNYDGKLTAPAGGKVTFTLYADNVATSYTVTLDGTADTKPTGAAGYESAAWTATFVNMPKSKIVDGAAVDIVYTIAETTGFIGYTTPTDADGNPIPVANGGTITNTQEVTKIKATKQWQGYDGTTITAPAGASVVFTLYKNGTALTDKTITLNAEHGWDATFINLPKYDYTADGATENTYTIGETTTFTGFDLITTEPVGNNGVIINKQKVVTVNATKEWQGYDGKVIEAPQGAKVTFAVMDGNTQVATVTLDGTVDEKPADTAGYESEAWKATFVNLPEYKYEEGKKPAEITYTIVETTPFTGFTLMTTDPVGNEGVIINKQDVVTVNATKQWQGYDGKTIEAPVGASVVFTLYKNGEKTNQSITLNAEDGWNATFANLPKYDYTADGATENIYTIGETTPFTGFTLMTTEPVGNEGVIINKQNVVTISADKEWFNAAAEKEIPEGAKVTFAVMDGNTQVATVTLDGTADSVPTGTAGYESEAWKATFINLPEYKYEEGKEPTLITYTIVETVKYPGYEVSYPDNGTYATDGQTITNRQTSTSLAVNKEWKLVDGTDKWPEGVTVEVQLTADGKNVEGKVARLTANQPSYKFEGLAKYQADGKTEIKYSVIEKEIKGYEPNVGPTTEGKVTITNTQEATSFTVEKKWDDNNNIYDFQTEEIKVQLMNGETKIGDPVTLNAANKWTYTWDKLVKFDEKGEEIKYTAEEVEVPLYYKATAAAAGGKFTITNTLNTSDLTIEKSVDKIVNVGENKTFVFNVVVTDKDGNKKYENQVGLTITGTDLKGTKTLKGIPAEKDDKVEVTELYSAGYEAGEAQITYDEATNTWKVTVVNTYDDIINGSGAVNSYGELNPTTPDAERYQGGAD